jgi:hypothetical protein
VVRKFTSEDAPEPLVEDRNIPDYWIRPNQPLLKTAGLHRFVWDMHHERPAVGSFSYPIAAIYGDTPRVPFGSWVMPATYTVRLTVDGKPQTQPLVVKMDPRVKASAADIKLQYDTSRAIDGAMRRAADALRIIRATTPKTQALTDLEQRITRANAPLGQLFNNVEMTDAAPMMSVLAAWKSASATLEAALAEVKR